ncbi:hypothetical protein ACH5RR_006549 [Cinchona calisaya]|uniref:Uncharacterized protein n=1 Tax=Cinchona calisaya TaxID=153742 RepID=A0ABD3APN1_9GENT
MISSLPTAKLTALNFCLSVVYCSELRMQMKSPMLHAVDVAAFVLQPKPMRWEKGNNLKGCNDISESKWMVRKDLIHRKEVVVMHCSELVQILECLRSCHDNPCLKVF